MPTLQIRVAFLTLACASLLGVRSGYSAPAANGWTPEQMIQLPRLADVRLSPDGRQVAYSLTVPVISTTQSEYRTRIHLVNADGTGDRELDTGGRNASTPRWSPDGKHLAYLMARQVYIQPVSGGTPVWATDASEGVSGYSWSPDGQQLAYLMTDGLSPARQQAIREKDDAFWVDADPAMSRLYVVPVPEGTAPPRPGRLLTPGSFSVTAQFDWSPDSKSIAFARTPTPGADDAGRTDLSVVNVSSGVVTTLAETPVAESDPRYSPDGKWIAFSLGGEVPRWTTINRLAILPASGGKTRVLPDTFDSRPTLLGWSANGSELLFTEVRGTLTRVSAMGFETGVVRDLYTGPDYLSGISLSPSRRGFGCLTETPERVPSAAIGSADIFSPRSITGMGSAAPRLSTGRTEVVRWKSDRKWEIEGLLTYPVDYRPGKRVPLLVLIHGGPAGAFGQTFTGRTALFPVAAFAARGYAVLSPNVRGSTGYGKKFQDQNHRDWGGSDYRDVMSGVDHVIKLGVADPERLGIMGWSYGGYLSGWAITQTHRFKAASFGAGVSNGISQTGTTDIPSARLNYFDAWPWDDPQIYLSRSPLMHARNVTTPTLIMHGEQDHRVPIQQSYEYYHALKRCGVPVKMLVLPRQAHGPSEPKMLFRVMNTNLDWFDQHLHPER